MNPRLDRTIGATGVGDLPGGPDTPSGRRGRLGPKARAGTLAALSQTELDVLVVGGGVVGAGTAVDAVTRGLTTGLVEMRDWASGTSSRSSKLIHGGLRYLEMLDFGLVREALRERGLLVQHLAPHLVRPIPFVYPLQHRLWERPYVGAGLALYDTLGMSSGHNRGLPHHKHLTRRAALRLVPDLKPESLVGAVHYYDAQVDDARLVATLVRTAAAHGAHCLNRAQVIGFLREGDRVTGCRVVDLETGAQTEVHARVVINAAGVWTDDIQDLVGGRGALRVEASKGIHLVVPRDRIRSKTGLVLRTDSSVLFVVPWGRHWIIGTTDTAWTLDKARPAATATDIEYLLQQVNRVLAVPLTADDVEGVYAGLRPLLTGESESTSKLSREHTVISPVPGLVLIAGGKLTTYRVMAKDAMDAAVHVLTGLGYNVPPSCTHRLPLIGADGYHARWNQRERLAHSAGLHVARVEHLLQRYGSVVDEVLELVRDDPALRQPLPGADDYLACEVVHAVRAEDARHLDDVLDRRTRISFETWDRGVEAASEIARLMALELGWDEEQEYREVAHYLRKVDAGRRSQRQPDDAGADAVRVEVTDIVPVVPRDAAVRSGEESVTLRVVPR